MRVESPQDCGSIKEESGFQSYGRTSFPDHRMWIRPLSEMTTSESQTATPREIGAHEAIKNFSKPASTRADSAVAFPSP
jgi:hypothetical protein